VRVFADDETASDAAVIYFDESAPKTFDEQLDALKLMNTNSDVPSLYSVSPDSAKLSIRALTYPVDSLTVLPLGLKTEKEGWITFNAKDIQARYRKICTFIYRIIRQTPNRICVVTPTIGYTLNRASMKNRFSNCIQGITDSWGYDANPVWCLSYYPINKRAYFPVSAEYP